MKASEINLQQLLEFRPSEGKLLLGRERMLLFRQDAMVVMRQLAQEHLGPELSRAMWAQFGYRCGKGDYAALSRSHSWESERDKIASGPVMHMWEGLVHVEVTQLAFDHAARTFAMSGIWRSSYEAEISLQQFGVLAQPCCHSLTGYASGWATAFFDHELVAVETLCIGKGDPHCAFEIRKAEDWGPEAEPYRQALGTNLESVVQKRDSIIEQQRLAMRELAAPVIQVWDGVLTVALVGDLDSERAGTITERLLAAVVERRAKFALLDITAIESVDAETASLFLRIVRAVQLLGAQCVITGIRPAVAQSIVQTSIDLAHIVTLASLQDGLRYALDRMGVRITATK